MKTIILSIFLFFVIISTFAQKTNEIIYHDFVPDTSFKYICSDIETQVCYPNCEEPIRFDVDSDGIIDLLYEADGFIFNGNTYLRSLNDVFTVVALGQNDTIICSELNWGLYAFAGHITNDYRFGIKKVIGDNTFYGYVNTRVEFISTVYGPYNNVVYDMICFVDYYAYCTIPNYPLLWGQTEISNSVPKTEAGSDGVKINFNNASNTVQIESLTKIKNVEIVSSNGQIANKTKNVGKNETEINVSGLQSGIYIVKVVLDDGRVVSGKVVR
jgi:hypothetical protein